MYLDKKSGLSRIRVKFSMVWISKFDVLESKNKSNIEIQMFDTNALSYKFKEHSLIYNFILIQNLFSKFRPLI